MFLSTASVHTSSSLVPLKFHFRLPYLFCFLVHFADIVSNIFLKKKVALNSVMIKLACDDMFGFPSHREASGEVLDSLKENKPSFVQVKLKLGLAKSKLLGRQRLIQSELLKRQNPSGNPIAAVIAVEIQKWKSMTT